MLFDPDRESLLDRLTHRVRLASALTPDLISDVIANACTRVPLLNQTGKAVQIDHLIAAGAWNDAVLALIELELPTWKLRRLGYEDGEWICSLSKQPNLPMALDETADSTYDVLPLAILSAFIEARRRNTVSHKTIPQTVPRARLAPEFAVCCDNFA